MFDPQQSRQKREARFAQMSDAEIASEKAKYEADLDSLTNGNGNEAYLKANSIRHLWDEQLRRQGKAA